MSRVILTIDAKFAGVFGALHDAEHFVDLCATAGMFSAERPAVVGYTVVEEHEQAIEALTAGAVTAQESQALTLLETALGERPASVVEGVQALIGALAEENDRADRMTARAAKAQSGLEEARRQGAEQERARIASRVEELATEARRESEDAWDREEGSGEADNRADDLEDLVRLIRHDWSGEEVDDG